jgi:hypothetical protein
LALRQRSRAPIYLGGGPRRQLAEHEVAGLSFDHAQQTGAWLQCKVMSQRDRWFGGTFDPDQLDKALNDHAQEAIRRPRACLRNARIAGLGS